MAKVSIIVPVYNVELFLNKCILSLINQTEKDIQIILVDDGSTDSSSIICDKYKEKDERITVIHKTNGGLSDARNAGMKYVCSKYLMFVDSDDYIEKETVALALRSAETEDSDIVMFDYRQVTEGEKEICAIKTGKIKCSSLAEDPSILLTTPSACNKLFKTELFEDVEFPKGMLYEDLCTVLKLYPKCKKISFLDCNPLYNYLIRDNSIMRNGDAERSAKHRIKSVNMIFSFYEDQNLYELYKSELDWIRIYHGYILPCREYINFSNNSKNALILLTKNISSQYSVNEIKNNKYFSSLTKTDKLVFRLAIGSNYNILKTLIKIKNIFKKLGKHIG